MQDTSEKTNDIRIYINSDGDRVDIIDANTKRTLWSIDNLRDGKQVEDKLYNLLELFAGGKRTIKITFPAIGTLEV